MRSWHPTLLAGGSAPLYRRLVDAMEADIRQGRLEPGTRLPPQRRLADALSISVGAVTRAYEEAALRGLVQAHVGRGTFVAERVAGDPGPSGLIDLSINTAPAVFPGAAFAEVFASPRQALPWVERLQYLPPAGLEADRRAASAWLVRTAGLEDADWRHIVCCNGAQGAMALAFATLCAPGDTVLCEAATFAGIKALAGCLGCRLVGVAMDAEGLDPDALDRAAAETGARVLYTLPTLQNPTARTAGPARRADIVRIARARDLWIVEDDVYALYARELGLPPLAALAPERCFHATSLSKSLSPGLRAGYLVTPAGEQVDRVVQTARALTHSPPGIGHGIATHWIESGKADDMAAQVRAEAGARLAMARAALGAALEAPVRGTSLHAWLPMSELDAERVAGRALRAGLRITPPATHAVPGAASATGLRLCVGSAPGRPALARALSILTGAMAGEVEPEPL